MLEDQCNVKKEFFPLFVPSNGKKALLVGGGTVALRRVKTLLLFRFDITVIAPEITDELKKLCEEGKIKIEHREFRDGDIEGQYLVIAATNIRAVNEKIGKLASEQMARDGELITRHPLLIQKAMADKLSDKISVIIAPPGSGGFIGSALIGEKINSNASATTEEGE